MLCVRRRFGQTRFIRFAFAPAKRKAGQRICTASTKKQAGTWRAKRVTCQGTTSERTVACARFLFTYRSEAAERRPHEIPGCPNCVLCRICASRDRRSNHHGQAGSPSPGGSPGTKPQLGATVRTRYPACIVSRGVARDVINVGNICSICHVRDLSAHRSSAQPLRRVMPPVGGAGPHVPAAVAADPTREVCHRRPPLMRTARTFGWTIWSYPRFARLLIFTPIPSPLAPMNSIPAFSRAVTSF